MKIISTNLGTERTIQWKNTEYKTGIFNVNLFARYYMPVAGDKLFFHTDFVLGFGSGSNEQGSYTQDVSTLAVGLRPGWDYFIGDKWALTLNWGWLGYSSYKVSDDGGDRTNTSFGLNVDFSTFGMGASWFF